VCREALIDGEIRAKKLDDFWQVRAEFIKKTYGADDYFKKVKSEFDKLNNLQPTDEVNLWFGNEAFCQVNLWFILWQFGDAGVTFYRVFPDLGGWDCSFENLNKCFEFRQKLTRDEIQQGKQLWKAFCFNDSDGLRFLSQTTSPNFKNLPEVCQVLIEKDFKPKQILHEITETGETDFGNIFAQFKEKAGIYGYSGLQVKNLLNS
jgi:hypothetical protein